MPSDQPAPQEWREEDTRTPVEPFVVAAARQLREAKLPDLQQEVFPWRVERTPYRLFLAEFLLVRTRSDIVARQFEDIVAQFPDFLRLASAPENALAAALEPLGLRKRVPLLSRAAHYILEHHAGQVPGSIEELLKVPGIGSYTAAAIAAFGYDEHKVPADVNILRFVSRLTGLPMNHPTKGSDQLRRLLPLLSQEQAGPLPEKLLDFCRLICRPRRPRCEACPLQDSCQYFAHLRSA
jgi:A/G-specific adenine glycosylase